MNGLKTLIENTLVPHSAFEVGRGRLEQCFNYSATAIEPVCIPVIGESRTGKSRLVEECGATHKQSRTEDGLEIPILYVTTPSKPTVKGLAALILQRLGDPRYENGTEISKTGRIEKLIKNVRTQMVVIDEFQHFYDKGSHKVMHHVADWLKTLVDQCKVSLVVAGLPTCRSVLEQNEQLAGRFLSPIIMPRFRWDRDDDREEFIGILEAFEQSMGEHFKLPRLGTDEMAFRFFCGTGGLIGYLTKSLRQAVWNALDERRRQISLRHLEVAHAQAVWNSAGLTSVPNPFARAFDCKPSETLLKQVAAIGATPIDRPTLSHLSRRPVRRPGPLVSAK